MCPPPALATSRVRTAIHQYPLPAAHLQEVASEALGDARVQQALQHESRATFVAHILPLDYGMVGMFADIGPGHMSPHIHVAGFRVLLQVLLPFLHRNQRREMMGTERREYEVVFSRVDDPAGQSVSIADIFEPSANMTPISVVDISPSGSVVRVIDPPRRSFWGAVKMPVF